MKKILSLLILLVGAFVLSGCDMFEDGVTEIWYDMEAQELHLWYDMDKPVADEETGERPEQFLTLFIKYESSPDWEVVQELDSYSADDLVIPFELREFGVIELKIVVTDINGNQVDQSDIMSIYIEQPQYIWHFNANFDGWSGQVNFDYGIDEYFISSIKIYKSNDGGINWEEVLEDSFENEDNKYWTFYYEYEEGNYVYKIEGLDSNGNVVSTVEGYHEVNVSFEQKNFEGNPELWHVDAAYNIWDQTVNVWWDAQGMFDVFRVEKSIDGENWELVNEVPRIISTLRFEELVDGQYFYKVSAVLDGEVVDELVIENPLRVDQNALLGHFDGWMDWNTKDVNLNWDYMQDDRISAVLVERSVNDEAFEVLGQFGNLKKQFTDSGLAPGVYVYKVSLLDEAGEVIDSLLSQSFEIEPPQHVYWLNAWHNQSTGEVEFNFDMHYEFIKYYTIEKSSDGGLTWEEVITNDLELNEDGWIENYIKVYEPQEGIYAYRITAYDVDGNEMGHVVNWNEVIVNYDHINYDEPTQIYHLDVQYHIYDNNLNIWWGSQGGYAVNLLEYSTDGENFEFLKEVPRVATFAQINDLPDGTYYFRLSVLDTEGNVLDTFTTEYATRVKQDALIGNFNVYYNWDQQQAELYFEYLKDDVAIVKIERRVETETEFTLLGEFGPLKTSLFDPISETETYIYRITLLDNEGNVLDQLESMPKLFEVNTY